MNDVPKLIKINVSNHSSDEGSDYWNNYYISVIDAKTGALDKKIKFTVDARNDKGQVMEISDKYVILLTDEYTLIELQTEKIYRGKDFEKIIEDNNAFVKNNIGLVKSFNQNFISLTTKQGDSYILSLKSLKLYQANPAKYWEIPDSLQFYHTERLKMKMASNRIDNYIYIADNDKGYSMENDAVNPSKSFIYEFEIQKFKPKSDKQSENVSLTVYDTVSFSYRADIETKKQINSKPYISARISNIIGNKLYILHHNEVSDNPKRILNCFDIADKKENFSVELPSFEDKRMDLYGSLFWAEDKKSFFYCKSGTTEPIYEYDALSGKLIAKYEN
jgi:hypothetical protein